MNDQTDAQLLRAYVEQRSEPAFAELVRRHLDFVYSAARRMVCDSHLAEDVAQGVFLALAKNAAQLTGHPVLSGWLHRTAQNIAAHTVRTDVRRRVREQEAAAMNELLATQPDALWEHIAPLLDAALGELDEADRDALLLRYFERKSAREMAEILGTSDDAAQKRVSRAVERLRELFTERGVSVGAGGLVAIVSANAVQAAPAGLAVTISATAALAGTTFADTVTATAIKTIAMTTLQKTAITATVAILAGAGIYQALQALNLREQNKTLQQQQAPLTGQIEQLTHDQNSLSNRLAALRDDNERLKSNTGELLRLRGEIAGLRRQTKALAEPGAALQQQEKPGARPFVPSEEFANAGLASPEATLKTLCWASRNKDKETLAKIFDAQEMQEILHQMMRKIYTNFTDTDFAGASNSFYLNFDNEKADVQGYQILSQQFGSTNKAALEIVRYLADGSSNTMPLKFHLVDGEWKMDLIEQLPESLPVTMQTTGPNGSITNTIVNFNKEPTFVPGQENSTNP